MVTSEVVRAQLQRIGADFRWWGRAAAKELPHILFEDEVIEHAIHGRYEGGFAVLCATNHRILLIDRKPMNLTLEDLRYEMISEVNYNYRLLNAALRVGTINRTLMFMAFNQHRLRELTNYIQHQVVQLRNQNQQVRPAAPDPFQPLYQGKLADASAGSTNLGQTALRPLINPYTQMPVIMKRRMNRFWPTPSAR
jgi:hypothetical protein